MTNEVVIDKNKIYYINNIPENIRIKNSMNGQIDIHKINQLHGIETLRLYNHSNMTDESDLSVINGWFDGIIQPSESQVKEAMILVIDEHYMLKAGGDSKSDSIYSSSFTMDIAHPETGLDTKVVVIKKYSTVFNEVLITAKEITKLYKACMSDKQQQTYKTSQIKGLIAMLLRNYEGFSVNCYDSQDRLIKDKNKIQKILLKSLYEKGNQIDFDKEINKLTKFYDKQSKQIFIEDKPNKNITEENKNYYLNKIQKLNELRDIIITHKNKENVNA